MNNSKFPSETPNQGKPKFNWIRFIAFLNQVLKALFLAKHGKKHKK